MDDWSVCRLCLQTDAEPLKALLDVTYKGINFYQIYLDIVGISFNFMMLPEKICCSCEMELLRAYKFREKCLETEKKLKDLDEESDGCEDVVEYVDFVDFDGMDGESKSDEEDKDTAVPMEVEPTSPKPKKTKRKARKQKMQEHTSTEESQETEEEPHWSTPIPRRLKDRHRKTYKCEECDKTFFSRDNYNLHMDKHNNFKRFPCNLCDERFDCYVKRRTHVYRVHLKKSYLKCDLCGRGFDLKKYLVNHINADHLKKKMYQCDTCGKSYKNSGSLNTHKKTHEGAMECEICGKKLAQIHSLIVHMKTHGAADLIDCPACHLKLRGRVSLEHHIRRVHPKKLHLIPPKLPRVQQAPQNSEGKSKQKNKRS